MNRHRAALVLFSAALLWAAARPGTAWAQAVAAVGPESVLSEARGLFGQLDYEHAVPVLDRAIALLEARTPRDAATRAQLADAYELRARSRYALGDRQGARTDFQMLLTSDPARTLTGVAPPVVALLEEVRKAFVGAINLTVTPPDADVLVDGTAVQKTSGRLPVVAGARGITVRKPGYRDFAQTITAAAGTVTDLNVILERTSATLTLTTAPAGVEVLINDVSRGVTADGPAPPEYGTPAIPATDLSKPMMLPDVATGLYVIQFRRECYVSEERSINVQTPTDYTLGPVKLARAIGKVSVQASPGGTIFLDGKPRGTPPATFDDVCEGRRLLEVRSRSGRYINHLDIHPGDALTIEPVVRPAVAILSAIGVPEGLRGADVRSSVEKAFQAARGVTLFAPTQEEASAALASEKLAPGWLSFDIARQPMGEAAKNVSPAVRQELSAKLARGLEVQGVAAITVPSRDDLSRVLLTILAAGSREPDTIDVDLDDPASVGRAIGRLNVQVPLFRASAGVQAIDVLDIPNPIVTSADPGPAGGRPALLAGEVILAANGQPVPDAARLTSIVSAIKAGDHVVLDVRDRAGAPKKVDLRVAMLPEVISLTDQTPPFNALVLELRRLLVTAIGSTEEPVVRLNLAVALMRVGTFTDARAELEKVHLADGPGVSAGTVQYLIGLCHEALGELREAVAALTAAAASKDATLTSDGPLIKGLAEQKLAQLAGRREAAEER